MEIKGENYLVTYDPSNVTITCEGSFRLRGTEEYAPIVDLLNQVIEQNPEKIILDLHALKFLNSSGINIFSKFVIKVRKLENVHLTIIGSEVYPWHKKSLKNFQRLLPSLTIEVV